MGGYPGPGGGRGGGRRGSGGASRPILVTGIFDDLRSRHLRFLQEEARRGPLTVMLLTDEAALAATGRAPKFGLAERRYFLEALRYVDRVEVAPIGADPDASAERLDSDDDGAPALPAAEISRFPYEPPPLDTPREAGKPRVVVTGCFDWLHTGHVRFFEEAAGWGELNVVIGSDANVRLLKGEGHPMQTEAERRYMVGSIRHVARCLVSSGSGWLDAEPEIVALGAGRYLVNADGDREEKRRYCKEKGLEYIVLERKPKEGLPRRASTDLRGF